MKPKKKRIENKLLYFHLSHSAGLPLFTFISIEKRKRK